MSGHSEKVTLKNANKRLLSSPSTQGSSQKHPRPFETTPTSAQSNSSTNETQSNLTHIREDQVPPGTLQKSIDALIEDARRSKKPIGPLQDDPFFGGQREREVDWSVPEGKPPRRKMKKKVEKEKEVDSEGDEIVSGSDEENSDEDSEEGSDDEESEQEEEESDDDEQDGEDEDENDEVKETDGGGERGIEAGPGGSEGESDEVVVITPEKPSGKDADAGPASKEDTKKQDSKKGD